MQLTRYTDYGIRVLIYLACSDEVGTVTEIAERFDISRHHLVKVAHHLSKLGYVETTRGRSGGMRLAREPEKIRLGDVVRDLEPDLNLVECFSPETDNCVISPACGLKHALIKAQRAFLEVLDSYTLKDVVRNRRKLAGLLGGV